MIHQSKNATAPHTSGPESANMKHAPSRAARRPSALILRADAMTDFGALRDLPVGLHIVSADGHIVDANSAELEMFGYDREEYVGHSLAEFHVDQRALREVLRRLDANLRLRDCEAHVRCKDGATRHVLLNSTPCGASTQLVHTHCITRHITDRRRFEARLRERELQLTRLFDAAKDALVIADGDDRLIDVNPAACALFGRPRQELVAGKLADF